MSLYTYPQSSLIDEVTFRKTANGANRAYLHACPEARPEGLRSLLQAMRQAGFECVPYTLQTKPVLEVRGFKRETELLKFLRQKQSIPGPHHLTTEQEDHISWSDMFRKNTLLLSGISMGIADLGFLKYGLSEKSVEDALAGIAYFSGSSTLSLYGRNDQSQIQIREMAELILQHARERGLAMPEDSAAASIGGQRRENSLKKLDNFFREYPSEIANMCYFTAGGLIAKSALQHRALAKPRPGMTAKQINEMRKGGWGDTLLGVSTMASGLLATIVKEKARDPDAPPSHGVQALKEWIQERPLAISGIGYIGSTLCHAYTTYTERKEARRAVKDMMLPAIERSKAAEKLKSIPWRILFVSATLVGELLLTISSKGHGEGVVSDTSVDTSVIAIAADLIAKQPINLQPQLIEHMAQFLGQPDVLAMNNHILSQLLHKQVEALRQNPWAHSADATAMPRAKIAPAAFMQPMAHSALEASRI